MNTQPPLLHRDDPARDPLVGHIKVTRADWLAAARDILIRKGVAHVKIAPFARRMEVSRSSFYWYFKDRADLLDALLQQWEAQNTAQIIAHCRKPASEITEAVCNFFACFVDETRFDRGLDFAVREWARSDSALRARVDAADAARIAAVTGMFTAHDYPAEEADARARILYFMQLGYHALDVREPLDERLTRAWPYMQQFTGRPPDVKAMADFERFARALFAGETVLD